MVLRNETIQFRGCLYDFIDPWIAEFDDLTRFNVNKMIMLAALICSLKLCNVLPELVLHNQIAVEQQFNGII